MNFWMNVWCFSFADLWTCVLLWVLLRGHNCTHITENNTVTTPELVLWPLRRLHLDFSLTHLSRNHCFQETIVEQRHERVTFKCPLSIWASFFSICCMKSLKKALEKTRRWLAPIVSVTIAQMFTPLLSRTHDIGLSPQTCHCVGGEPTQNLKVSSSHITTDEECLEQGWAN